LAIIIIDREGAARVWRLRFEHSLQKLTHLRIVGTFDQVGENVEELVERLVPWKCAEDDKGGLRAGAMSDVAKRPLAVNVSENKVKVLHAPPENNNKVISSQLRCVRWKHYHFNVLKNSSNTHENTVY
jgi:hypothetical protein